MKKHKRKKEEETEKTGKSVAGRTTRRPKFLIIFMYLY